MRRLCEIVRFPLAFYLLTRVIDGVMITVAMRRQPALTPGEAQSYLAEPMRSAPGYLTALTNWDGQWYLQIVRHGWPHVLPVAADGSVASNTWAFYPVFPALIRLVMMTGAGYALAATIVSTTAGGVACVLLHALVRRSGGPFAARTAVVALCTFPAAVLLQAAYSESVALVVLLVCLWLLAERRYLALVPAALLLGVTRPIGLPLAAVIAVHGLVRLRAGGFPVAERVRCSAAALAAGIGFTIWPITCAIVTGRLRGYVETEKSWESDDKSGWPSWLAHVVHFDAQGAVALALLVLAVGLVAGPWGRRWGVLRLWAPVYLLYLLAATRPIPSMIRFGMLGLVPWVPVPTAPRRRTAIMVLVALAVLGLVAQWFWVTQFYVIDDTSGYP